MANSTEKGELPYLNSAEIRQKFLSFFEKKGHKNVASSPLVPFNDATLLFTNSGMVQFKDVFSGKDKRNYQRAVTAQKCIRAGGKHNDLENVGYTARHHTFFEMLGNFSFGDYFKKDAIRFAWEFLTVELKLPPSRLWVSVHLDDDEAEKIWIEEIGFPKSRISRCGEDNFWQMGDTGPCGPCSEIFFDHGEHIFGGPPGSPDEDGDRFVEIWNLVFMQFNRHASGEMEKLPKPSVDTGMGLERISSVMQSVTNNYDTDLFKPIIAFASQKLGVDKNHTSLKVLADHIRSCSFLIAEGVYPGNESRNYVLRRIIRRAIRHAHKCGAQEVFFYQLVSPLIQTVAHAYPELKANQKTIEKILKNEEEQFRQTLEVGMKLLNQEMKKNPTQISAEMCFNLYDTHGFPLDLTADIAREHQLKVDLDGFNVLMQKQKALSKKSANQFKDERLDFVLDLKEKTEFVGYEHTQSKVKLVGIVLDNEQLTEIRSEQSQNLKPNQLALIFNQTPFYAESGGQVGDTGQITKLDGKAVFEVVDTQKYGEAILHFGTLKQGSIQIGDEFEAQINEDKRAETAKHHSATHLLQAALIAVLGSHIEQKGSLVQWDKLRFDFSHHSALKPEEIKKIERTVNQQILYSKATLVETMPKEKAIAKGAKAMFGEKYGDEVRVLSIGGKKGTSTPFSLELCGGTHIQNAAEIGLFKIVTESSIASGIRRIEAVCGSKAIEMFNQYQDILTENSRLIQGPFDNQTEQIKQLQDKLKQLSKENEILNQNLAKYQLAGLLLKTKKVKIQTHDEPLQILTEIVDFDKKTMMTALDYLKDKLGLGIIVLASLGEENKVNLYCAVSQPLTQAFSANELIQHFTTALNGKGGGRKDLAQAGLIDNQQQLPQLLKQFVVTIEKQAKHI